MLVKLNKGLKVPPYKVNYSRQIQNNVKQINIKGGFPPVYEVNLENNSYREFSPNLKVKNILEKNDKSPFINISSKDGGFLKNFIKFKTIIFNCFF